MCYVRSVSLLCTLFSYTHSEVIIEKNGSVNRGLFLRRSTYCAIVFKLENTHTHTYVRTAHKDREIKRLIFLNLISMRALQWIGVLFMLDERPSRIMPVCITKNILMVHVHVYIYVNEHSWIPWPKLIHWPQFKI